tara:strand:- start:693 stop:872 length:180 start_codon:yes stop_codon:yes gene_type:complete
MKFQEAVVKSIKSYMDGKLPEELEKVTGEPMLYTLEYFDDLEKELEIEDPEIKEVEDDA